MTVNIAAHLRTDMGYGAMAEYVAVGMARAGARVNVLPGWRSSAAANLLPETVRLLQGSQPYGGGPILYSNWLAPVRDDYLRSPAVDDYLGSADVVIHTMWEADELPVSWVTQLNRARAVVVPTRYVAATFLRSGVKVPIEVVPDGIDPTLYRHQERPRRGGVTTLIVSTARPRKHIGHAVRAWQAAFSGDRDARLLIKTDPRHRRDPMLSDERITVVDRNEESRGIAHWYRKADVLLALGSEGFGLPAVEAMATGMPVIALDSEGQSDLCEDAKGLVLPVRAASWEPCEYPNESQARGRRGVPDVAQAAQWLRWVARHRRAASEMGAAASRWARSERDVWCKGPRILEIMRSIG